VPAAAALSADEWLSFYGGFVSAFSWELVGTSGDRPAGNSHATCVAAVGALIALPAAQQPSVATATELLDSALQAGMLSVAAMLHKQLQQLQSVTVELSVGRLAQLLQQALHMADMPAVRMLCAQSGMSQIAVMISTRVAMLRRAWVTDGRDELSSSSVVRLLENGVLQVLLPPEQHTEDTVLQLLLTSFTKHASDLAQQLLALPAAQQLSVQAMDELLVIILFLLLFPSPMCFFWGWHVGRGIYTPAAAASRPSNEPYCTKQAAVDSAWQVRHRHAWVVSRLAVCRQSRSRRHKCYC
jgi:hypothetical protein